MLSEPSRYFRHGKTRHRLRCRLGRSMATFDVRKADVSFMRVLETDRLILRWLAIEDAEFILRLLNEPSFLRFIGDKGVRTIDDARDYILNGPVHSYERFGFGLYLTELKETHVPIGICGLLKRDSLKDVDVGFAFLPEFWKQGYAFESAAAVMDYGRNAFGLDRIVAITSPGNDESIKVLVKLGLEFERTIKLSEDGPDIELFGPGARVSVREHSLTK